MMSATEGSGHSKYAGLLPVAIRSTAPEDDLRSDRQPPVRKRAWRDLARFLMMFCIGVAATLAWLSYGNAARQTIANSYPQLGWLAPRDAVTAQNAPAMIALTAAAAPNPDQPQLDATLGDLHAIRLSLDQIAAGQELITRSIEEIATRMAGAQEQMTRSTDQTTTSSQTAVTIATAQEPMTRDNNQTATSIDQAPSEATSIPIESRGNPASLPPTGRLNIKPAKTKPPQTLLEKGKPLSAASGHDASCLPSASAVLQNHPGGWPSWTLRAPGHEGTVCWYAAARSRASAMIQGKRRSNGDDVEGQGDGRNN
jgi:hypothetical protein